MAREKVLVRRTGNVVTALWHRLYVVVRPSEQQGPGDWERLRRKRGVVRAIGMTRDNYLGPVQITRSCQPRLAPDPSKCCERLDYSVGNRVCVSDVAVCLGGSKRVVLAGEDPQTLPGSAV